ncbi:MAG: acetyl-CoA carboxylase carboxyltransferase subunit alpha [Candidatus Poribacteria bacterium]|nr:acetyl-CoA carboxylase carboxyltransferase subunit alpha [Candidatus Poribacteria bacterium]
MQSKLTFEKPLIELEEHLNQLKSFAQKHPDLDISEGLKALERNTRALNRKSVQTLSRWDKVWFARHELRPQSFSYIESIFENPIELYGDKLYSDDRALVGGLAWFEKQPVVYLAQQKGRNLSERQEMNFGYTHPEGYRKALRLMEFAEKFNRPVICFVDTPGAHFDGGSEERGQSIAIAENLAKMSQLQVPILVILIGEGGSGGALAIGIGDRVLMMENSIYCVAPPEACSGIVWKDDGEHAPEAAEALRPLAADLIEFGIIDEIIPEPVGGAHRNPTQAIKNVKKTMTRHFHQLLEVNLANLLENRYNRYRNIGVFDNEQL